MRFKAINILIYIHIFLIIATCSPRDISGTYKHEEDPSQILKLTKDKKLIFIKTGDAADYSIEVSKIIVTNPMFGGAVGKIEANKLIFPKGRGPVAHSLQGTWIKQSLYQEELVIEQKTMRQEVEQISETIRSAHLNKDINKWRTCYNPSYPNLSQVERQMLELWKNYDVKEVNYRIANVQRQGERQASADLVWNIQIYDHRTHDYSLLRDAYKIILEKSNGGWQIRDSKEKIEK